MRIIIFVLFTTFSSYSLAKEPSFVETVKFVNTQLQSANAKLIDPLLEDRFRYFMTIGGAWSGRDVTPALYKKDENGEMKPDCALGIRFVDYYSRDNKAEAESLDISVRDLSVAYIQEDENLDDESRVIDLRGKMLFMHELENDPKKTTYDSINRAQILLDSPARAGRVRNAIKHLIKLCPPLDDLPF